ncbi:NfeD family protein [Nostocoides sp. F2B08]|uniref:NfeD family protein n=1 Tax=Nostocoides sp. F2B08 TaxID=2653936 RepID=UPI001262EB73|nr:NfeD family protein [Tetrasphaera sp. F2B08]KAB7744509.1 NfeD family protein [Tetrasphaera sp. F2B08]
MEWLADNWWVVWLGLALVLMAVEAATVDFVFVMLAGGALAGAAAAGLGASLPIQVVTAVVTAFALLFVVRPVVKRRFMDSETDHGIGSSALIGRDAWVLETITETDGRVKLAGEVWSARGPSGAALQPGTQVRVIEIQGATVHVAPLDQIGR